jgi:hypothetical protein
VVEMIRMLMLYSSMRKLRKKMANQRPPMTLGLMPAKTCQSDSFAEHQDRASTAAISSRT